MRRDSHNVRSGPRGAAALVALAVAGLSAPAGADGIADIIDRLDPHRCYAGDLVCVTIPAPLDHENPDDRRRLDIEFAVHFATGEHRGTLIYFVGGPGQAGVPFGSAALEWFDPEIPEHYDIVFFDQRGTGPRHGVECLEASTDYWMTHWDFDELDSVVASVQRFVADCVAESGRAEILPYLSSEQAVRDVELFRQAIGAPRVWLYGASYGTYIAQVYAATYPDAIEAVILDAVMDPAIDLAADSALGAEAGEALFARVAAACGEDHLCRTSFESDPLSYYDRLMAELEEAPLPVLFPLSDGELEQRMLTPEMLFGSLSMSLYTPFDRTSFLHVLATAEHGDYVPLLRMGYRSLEVDPDTLLPSSAEGTTFDIFWGAFYGISCADYAAPATDPTAAAHAAFEAGLARRDTYPRFFGYLIGLAPECQFWPTLRAAERPPLFTGGDYKTLILAGDADAATPIANARAVFARVPGASMVTVRGGPHVAYGWGEACVDEVVTRWMVDGRVPEPGNRTCDQTVLDTYYVVDVVDRYASDNGNDIAWGVVAGIDSAMMSSGWDGGGGLRVGCSHGGTLTMRPTQGDEYVRRFRMDDCRIWPDVAVSGLAVYSDTTDEWGWEMTLEVDGAHSGDLAVRFDFAQDSEIVTGEIDDASAGTSTRAAVAGSKPGDPAKQSEPVKPTSTAANETVELPGVANGANR
jgi:pimeloyl-ACP methyl ester carboxylesterase